MPFGFPVAVPVGAVALMTPAAVLTGTRVIRACHQLRPRSPRPPRKVAWCGTQSGQYRSESAGGSTAPYSVMDERPMAIAQELTNIVIHSEWQKLLVAESVSPSQQRMAAIGVWTLKSFQPIGFPY